MSNWDFPLHKYFFRLRFSDCHATSCAELKYLSILKMHLMKCSLRDLV
jgi:hypothetical protein